MVLEFDEINGQTPLDEEEKAGLRIKSISTQGELNEFEQQNIEEAIVWLIGQKKKVRQVLKEEFICSLHKRMYRNVWSWAGAYRKSNKNIGVNYWDISLQLRLLVEDGLYWFENQTFEPDEIAIRFKHRLVSIHCFSNGNGRHSRLMADVIAEKLFHRSVFTWGAANLSTVNTARERYLKAIKAADLGDFQLLLDFARS